MNATGDGYGIAIWSSPRWRAEATDWLDDRLAALGERRTGDVEQPHLRPWATTLRAATSRHPFTTMLVTLRVVRHLTDDGPAAETTDDAGMPFGWLAMLLDSSYLGDVDAD